MDYESLLKNFDELNSQINAAKQEMRGKSKGLVESSVAMLFDACHEIQQVHWTQYTPYFNDGEACEFGVNEINFLLVGDEDFEPYESSPLYTQRDLDRAIKDYESAVLYNKSPEFWREQYLKDYETKYGRPYGYGSMNVKPYPSDPSEAQESIDEIKEQMEKIPAERASAIMENFQAFKNAMSKIPEDIMETLYGDHAMIIIDRDGTTVEEYSHD